MLVLRLSVMLLFLVLVLFVFSLCGVVIWFCGFCSDYCRLLFLVRELNISWVLFGSVKI